MKIEEPGRSDLPASLILVTSVILTVVIALFLAFSDDLQTRLPAPIRPTTIAQDGEGVATALPTATATPSSTSSATPQAGSTTIPTPTPVSIIAEAGCDEIPAGWQEVVVGPGETLYSLSVQYGATVGEIRKANCLETTAVLSGSTIYVPVVYPTRPRCGPPGWWEIYIVRRGDTLYSLARRYHTTVYAIMNANCMTSTYLVADRKLFLPPLPATVPPPTVLPTNTPSATPTATQPPSPTSDGTPTITPTPIATSSSTPVSPTPTSSPTATETAGPTVTSTSTATASPTGTPTATPGATNTAVPTATSTQPPTSTSTVPAPTNTSTPTATQPPPSPTSTPTASPPPKPFESS